jgi:type II secretory pathway component PulF
LEKGCGLIPALEHVPELLPPQVLAMLKVGATLGDFRPVLPACRHLLNDGTSQSRALINYQVAFGLVLNPLMLFILPFIFTSIFPVMRDISSGLNIAPAGLYAALPALLPILFLVQMGLLIACYAGSVFLFGGTRFVTWLQNWQLPLRDLADRLFLRVPWRRKRLQRDFSAMLALLLDAGVPEEKALSLAASSTANHILVKRAEKAADEMRHGATLIQAVQLLDDTGELRWRLANGAHGARGFFAALEGWQTSLDARAFQLEQSAAQTFTTSMVLINAVTVALVASGVFQFISQLNQAPFRILK